MKFGDTLRQRSLADPGWSHHNIDYNDIKSLIKEYTTPGKGKAISIPGQGDRNLLESENHLFDVLQDQHDRIDLVVRSKAGEIQRRLDHSKRQLRLLAAKQDVVGRPIHARRLERYGQLDNEVAKAGDDIRALARFTSTQRTAFRKLLKKHKKWTGSAQLEDRFREEVLDQPKSFTKLDLGWLLDEYSTVRQGIKTLYEGSVHWAPDSPTPDLPPSSSTIRKLQSAIDSGSKVAFDTAIATVALGQEGMFASFFVHPENVVELQAFLLQHAQYYGHRSRSNSVATPVSTSPRPSSSAGPQHPDYHMIAADSLERFASEQSALTVHDREQLGGSFPQRARACVRWNDNEDAMACLRSKSGKAKAAALKRKHAHAFFDKHALFSASQSSAAAESDEDVNDVRQEFIKTPNIQLLFHYNSCRTRLTGTNESADSLTMATLDTAITISSAREDDQATKEDFPFALLLVRQEGTTDRGLLAVLDESHLVERVRGFSLEYHAVWSVHKPASMRPPFWLPILSRDIRKLPPPAMRHSGSSGSASRSAGSRGSLTAPTDSTTAVETTNSSVRLETPPLKSFRKKRRRMYDQTPAIEETQQRYWNEYDDPEDGEDDPNAFVLYVNPNEESIFDRFFDRLAAMFGRKQDLDHDQIISPTTLHSEDGTSSDDEESALISPHDVGSHRARLHGLSFGTFASSPAQYAQREARAAFIPNFTATCYIASLVILLLGFVLATTGRHRYIHAVDAGVFCAVVCSLIFVIVGFYSVLRLDHGTLSVPAWAVCIALLLADAVGSGGLVAWMVWG